MTSRQQDELLHQLTVGTMLQGVSNIRRILKLAETHVKNDAAGLEALLQTRLYPDMFNLLQQLQYVCYLSVDFARHFTSEAAPRVGYDEETWAQASDSVAQTENYLSAIKPIGFAARAKDMLPAFMDDSKGLPAFTYAARVIVPDFHFHLTVAYALLRHKGVPVGKADYLGPLDLQPRSPA